jgi:hypothetical protein
MDLGQSPISAAFEEFTRDAKNYSTLARWSGLPREMTWRSGLSRKPFW